MDASVLEGKRVIRSFYECNEKNLEWIYHGPGLPGGDSGGAAGWRAAGWLPGVYGAVRLHGADLSCGQPDLCEKRGPRPASGR